MKVGLTLNRIKIESHNEIRDSLDVNWISLLNLLKITPVLIPSTIENLDAYLNANEIDAFILTGGNNIKASGHGDYPEREEAEKIILNHALKSGKKILGICRGMQFINAYLGGTLSPIENHVRTRHHITSNPDFYIPSFEVNSFHSFGIFKKDLAPELETISICDSDSSIEAFKHKNLPVVGLMWHPERDLPFTQENIGILTKFFGE